MFADWISYVLWALEPRFHSDDLCELCENETDDDWPVCVDCHDKQEYRRWAG